MTTSLSDPGSTPPAGRGSCFGRRCRMKLVRRPHSRSRCPASARNRGCSAAPPRRVPCLPCRARISGTCTPNPVGFSELAAPPGSGHARAPGSCGTQCECKTRRRARGCACTFPDSCCIACRTRTRCACRSCDLASQRQLWPRLFASRFLPSDPRQSGAAQYSNQPSSGEQPGPEPRETGSLWSRELRKPRPTSLGFGPNRSPLLLRTKRARRTCKRPARPALDTRSGPTATGSFCAPFCFQQPQPTWSRRLYSPGHRGGRHYWRSSPFLPHLHRHRPRAVQYLQSSAFSTGPLRATRPLAHPRRPCRCPLRAPVCYFSCRSAFSFALSAPAKFLRLLLRRHPRHPT
mmetsp:Transcript_368/g.731  ORF Transcript_368/g.731 Transcript_368/m.731 type:complete len:347 (+) Transcript_368:2315-3355(+)